MSKINVFIIFLRSATVEKFTDNYVLNQLIIYVKLKAYTKSRSVIINESGRDGSSVESDDDPNGTEVNFIATKLDENSPDKISYATTDYTEIGGLNLENNKSGTLEGFSINSINSIKYYLIVINKNK